MKYPNIEIPLSEMDGNGCLILGRCIKEAKKAGLSQEIIKEFEAEAIKGDYDHLLRTCMLWFNCN